MYGDKGRIKENEEEATVMIKERDNGGLGQGGSMGDEEDRLDIISDRAKCCGAAETAG